MQADHPYSTKLFDEYMHTQIWTLSGEIDTTIPSTYVHISISLSIGIKPGFQLHDFMHF